MKRKLYKRIYFTEKVKFGYDKPIYSGMSINLSPDGVHIISDKTLVPESDIIINIYVYKIKADNTEKLEIITVEGEVICVKHFPDAPSKMGIRFKESNEELVRTYAIIAYRRTGS